MQFKDRDLQAFWIDPARYRPKRIPANLYRVLYRKLQLLDAAETSGSLNDLRIPPGNRLEALRGDREGQHSIRVNQRWRLCFKWTRYGVIGVELVDYH